MRAWSLSIALLLTVAPGPARAQPAAPEDPTTPVPPPPPAAAAEAEAPPPSPAPVGTAPPEPPPLPTGVPDVSLGLFIGTGIVLLGAIAFGVAAEEVDPGAGCEPVGCRRDAQALGLTSDVLVGVAIGAAVSAFAIWLLRDLLGAAGERDLAVRF